jgi:hypothetical protein
LSGVDEGLHLGFQRLDRGPFHRIAGALDEPRRGPADVDVVLYGSLFENEAYRELVEQKAARPLPKLEDAIDLLIERIHRAGQLPTSPI